MSETNYSLDRDLMEARAMAESLEGYVRGDQLYGTVGGVGMFAGDPDLPSMTVGHLLLRLRRLKALERHMTPEQKAILTDVEAAHDSVRQAWTQHYLSKLLEEVGARLRALEAYTAECEDNSAACAEAYGPEALRRTIIQEIVDALQRYKLPDSDLPQSLRRHDEQLRRFTEPWHFLWDDMLREAYPKETYWWLYEHPIAERAGR